MEPRIPVVRVDGPFAEHDQCCAVLPHQPAVIDLNKGVFLPSWQAQEQGWRLIKAKTWLQRLAIRMLWSG